MPTRKAQDVWKELVDHVGEDEVDRAAGARPAQVESDLSAAGFDVEAERAAARDFLGELDAPASAPVRAVEAQPVRVAVLEPTRRRGPRPVMLWLAAAATVTVGGGALYVALRAPEPIPRPRLPSPPAPSSAPTEVVDERLLVAADVLRQQARTACAENRFNDCVDLLDRARSQDPEGERAPDVVRLRDQIRRSLKPGR